MECQYVSTVHCNRLVKPENFVQPFSIFTEALSIWALTVRALLIFSDSHDQLCLNHAVSHNAATTTIARDTGFIVISVK